MKLIFFYLLQHFCLLVSSGVIRNNSFWDKVVFRKIQEGMGGRLRLMLVGSAPLAGNVLTFIRCSLGCMVSKCMFADGRAKYTCLFFYIGCGRIRPNRMYSTNNVDSTR